MLTHPMPDPVALHLGPVSIHWYGLMYVLAFAMFIALGRVRIKQPHIAAQGWKNEDLDDMLFYGMLGVVVGGRLGEVFFYQPAHFMANPLDIFKIWQGGMSFHGGFLGVVIAVAVFARANKIDLLRLGDLVAPCAPFGLFFGRVANFINGELWGRPTNAPWGVAFPGAPDALPRHPSQLYEAALEGVVLLLILRWATHGAKLLPRQGMLTGLFLLFYGLFRIAVEFLREPDAHLPEMLREYATLGMLLSIPMVLAGVWLIARARREPSGAAEAEGPVPA